MGRRPTRAADNPFCKARLAAAEYNERLRSKEGASEFLGISVSTLSDYELGITKVVPPDMVLKMADLYNAPELRNYYCTSVCPLGCDMPKAYIADLDRITLRMLSSFRRLEGAGETLLDIIEDGIVDEMEKPELESVIGMLEELEQATQGLKLWAQKNL